MANPKNSNSPDEENEDESVTLSENEGVDEEDLKNAPANEDGDEGENENEKTAVDPRVKMMEGGDDDFEENLPEHGTPKDESAAEPEESLESRPVFTSRPMEDVQREDRPDRPEHTLDDLAEEPEPLPAGVKPGMNKNFNDYQDENQSQIPHWGSQFPSSGVYSNREPGRGGGSKLKLFFLAVVALLVVAAALYLLKGKSLFKRGEQPAPSESPTISTQESTPAPTPAFDRSKFTIDVLNGTSKSGLAASVSGKLKDLGYQQGKVGNATNSAFTQTQVLVKSGDSDLLQQLIQDLSPDYSATDGGLLKDSSTSDGEVIIGTK